MGARLCRQGLAIWAWRNQLRHMSLMAVHDDCDRVMGGSAQRRSGLGSMMALQTLVAVQLHPLTRCRLQLTALQQHLQLPWLQEVRVAAHHLLVLVLVLLLVQQRLEVGRR